jgi:hypothetical protein
MQGGFAPTSSRWLAGPVGGESRNPQGGAVAPRFNIFSFSLLGSDGQMLQFSELADGQQSAGPGLAIKPRLTA